MTLNYNDIYCLNQKLQKNPVIISVYNLYIYYIILYNNKNLISIIKQYQYQKNSIIIIIFFLLLSWLSRLILQHYIYYGIGITYFVFKIYISMIRV